MLLCAVMLISCSNGDVPESSDEDFPPGLAPEHDREGAIEVGQTRIVYGFSTHCGVEYLYVPIAGSRWQAVDLDATGIDPVPEAWRAMMADGTDQLDVMITRTAEDELRVMSPPAEPPSHLR